MYIFVTLPAQNRYMAKSKLEEIVEKLSEKERQRFELYLDSPFFKVDGLTKSMFKALTTSPIKQNNFKEELFSRAFKERAYDDKQMRYYISNLNKHLETFLSIQQLEKDPTLSDHLVATVYAERDCEKSFLMLGHEISGQTELADATTTLDKYRYAELFLNYTGKKLSGKSTPDYTDTLFYLDSFYLLKKLQLSCELTNLANILQKQYKIQLSDELKSLAQTEPFQKNPAIQIYSHILNFLMNAADEESFLKSIGLVKEHAHLFKPGEVAELYQYIKNYCVRKINQGNRDYLRSLLDIFKTMLSNKPLMRHDYLSQWEFKNIVSISLRLNEKKWCEEFIAKYIHYLKPEEQSNALAYNLAYSYFIDDDYKKSIRKLQEVELKDVFYQLDARVILLKCYFELDDYDSFFYQVSSFRLFLLRNKSVSEYQKNINRNLISFLAAIMRAGSSKAKLRKIKTEIEAEKNVADLNWLMNKVSIALGE